MEAITETPAAPTPASFQLAPIQQLKEHPLNPRKRFDPAKLAEPAESVKAMGILNPLLVRIVPVAAKDRGADGGAALQILAGARRYRAAKKARAPFPERQVRVRASEGWVASADNLSSALCAAIKALGGDLSFEDRRRLVRWLCEVYSIEPKAL